MSYSTICDAAESGALLGTGRTSKAQVGADQEVFWSPADFSFADVNTATGIAAWNTAVAAGNLHYIGVIEEFDSNDVEPVYWESPNGNLRVKTAESKRVRQYRLVECSCTHAALRSFDGQTGRLFFRTSDGYLRARYESDGTVKGFEVSQFDVGILTAKTNEAPAFTPIDVTFSNPQSDDDNTFEDSIDFDFSDVDQVYNAELSASAITAGASLDFTLVANKDCSNVFLSGLAVGNLVAKDANGTTLTIASVVEGTGDYAVSVTTAETSITLQIDGVQTVGSTLYVSKEITVSA